MVYWDVAEGARVDVLRRAGVRCGLCAGVCWLIMIRRHRSSTLFTWRAVGCAFPTWWRAVSDLWWWQLAVSDLWWWQLAVSNLWERQIALSDVGASGVRPVVGAAGDVRPVVLAAGGV